MTSDTLYSGFELESKNIKDSKGITLEEEQARIDLAAAYRLTALWGWDDLIYTHMSVRVPGTDDQFLVNPLGLAFDEITASSLVKINLDGDIVGNSEYKPNSAGFVIHGGIHQSRHDAVSVIHLHTTETVALSMQKDGLLPLNQHALRFYKRLGYHEYEGIALNTGERQRIIQALGNNNALILKNHGFITVGQSVGHAFVEAYYLHKAAAIQMQALFSGAELTWPSEEVCELVVKQWTEDFTNNKNCREWPSLLRKLDRIDPSYRN